MKVRTEEIDGKPYAIIQFSKLLKPSTNGYYSGNDEESVERENYFVDDLNTKLIEFYKRENAKSVVDFGCGLCAYAKNLKKAGIPTVEGYDGNPFTVQLTSGFAGVLDLSVKRDLGKRFEWVQSFEVGQQIQP